jgi:hypothetical protein
MRLERGIIYGYDSTNHVAAVQCIGSLGRLLIDVPVAHHIGEELLDDGASCAVAFFGEDGSQAVVLATFDGAPEPWITSALVKNADIATADLADEAVTPAKLSFSPCTPEIDLQHTASSQTVTNSWAVYSGMQKQVTVSSGTISVLIAFTVDFECTAYTNWNIDVAEVYDGSSRIGQPSRLRTNAVNDRCSVTVVVMKKITSTTTFYGRIYKAMNRNTEVANSGTFLTAWWEDTS